jgi:hypothetical protein
MKIAFDTAAKDVHLEDNGKTVIVNSELPADQALQQAAESLKGV